MTSSSRSPATLFTTCGRLRATTSPPAIPTTGCSRRQPSQQVSTATATPMASDVSRVWKAETPITLATRRSVAGQRGSRPLLPPA